MQTGIILFLFSINAVASLNLKVESDKESYIIGISEKKFSYQSKMQKVTKKIQPCASRAYSNFSEKIEGAIQQELLKTPLKIPNAYRVKINEEQVFIPVLSKAGSSISKLDTDVTYLISEAVYRCSKK